LQCIREFKGGERADEQSDRHITGPHERSTIRGTVARRRVGLVIFAAQLPVLIGDFTCDGYMANWQAGLFSFFIGLDLRGHGSLALSKKSTKIGRTEKLGTGQVAATSFGQGREVRTAYRALQCGECATIGRTRQPRAENGEAVVQRENGQTWPTRSVHSRDIHRCAGVAAKRPGSARKLSIFPPLSL